MFGYNGAVITQISKGIVNTQYGSYKVFEKIRIVSVEVSGTKHYYIDLYIPSMANTGNNINLSILPMCPGKPTAAGSVISPSETSTVIVEKTIEYE